MIDFDKYEGHTPGPWDWCMETQTRGPLGKGGNRHAALRARSVVMSPNWVTSDGDVWQAWISVNEHNARLIADAPALLAEVKRLRWLIEQYGHDPDLRFAVEGW